MLVLIALLASVLLAVLLAVNTATGVSVQRQARLQLDVGRNVFTRLLELRTAELNNGVGVLAADFGFREAVASADLPTIRSALLNQARRIGADQALYFDAAGELRISVSASTDSDLPADLQALAPYGDALMIAVINDRAGLLVDAPVLAPILIGEVAMAFLFDETLAADMRALTGLELRFVTRSNGQQRAEVSTLGTQTAVSRDVLAPAPLLLDRANYLSDTLTLLDTDGLQVEAELLSSLDSAREGFSLLKRELALITLVALLLSSLAAARMAASLAWPVGRLAYAARRIGLGDYETAVRLERTDELGTLAQSIDDMRRDIAEREQQTLYDAYHDPLTELGNLRRIVERIADAVGSSQHGAFALIELDDTDDLVRSAGQQRYETLVRALADRLRAAHLRDVLLGWQPAAGFLVVIENRDLERSVMIVDQLMASISQSLFVDGQHWSLQCRAGVVEWPAHSRDPNELLRQVRIAVADANPGPNRIAVYQVPRDLAYQRRLRLIRDIYHAPAHNELSVVFQPKLRLADNSVHKLEALVRWHHSHFGDVRPDEFIALAEQTGSIGTVTRWVLDSVAAQMRIWHDSGLALQVAVNVSTRDLDDDAFPAYVDDLLQARHLDPALLTLEVTESAVMENPERNIANLHRFRALGFRLAVDDYGTGYSSLATLKRLPVHELKIDRSFIRELAHSADDAVIVGSTIDLAHAMGLQVVAEGVEETEALDWLRRHGCDEIQGYWLAKPMPAPGLLVWLQARTQEQPKA
jgi:EAL domain-containing protein (putative c-di-GMP-specific phosphodiesterase class I)/GGDEF domain-containing protein